MTENIVIRSVAVAGGIYAFLNLYAFLVSDRLIFQPQTPGYTRLPHEFRVESGSGEMINTVYLEHPNAEFTILFSHGNAEDLSNVVPFMLRFYDLGYSVLMYDYRGYGTSEGTPSVRKAKQDVAAAYRWLVEEKQIAPESIIAHGRSLGGGLATWLAANRQVGGLAIECSFVSAFRVRTGLPLLPWDKLNNLRSIKKVNCPVLVIHGLEDGVVPAWHGQKLYDAAPGKKKVLWIEDGQHNDYVYVAEEKYLDTFQSFMKLVSEYQSTNVE